ncbi:hypothetical protein WDV93_25460 [Pantoea ananatis]
MKKLRIDELFESLRIIGHSRLWLRGDPEDGLPVYYEVISDNERELAWWCDGSRSWFLNEEADTVTVSHSVPDLPPNRELTEENIFCLSTTLGAALLTN